MSRNKRKAQVRERAQENAVGEEERHSEDQSELQKHNDEEIYEEKQEPETCTDAISYSTRSRGQFS